MVIPKIIHYCWFGRNPLPEMAQKCIASWRKYLPDYEIKEWNEDNFDVKAIAYTREAYRLRKYAFVSDYARFWILNKYGGLYFDTDVEIIKPIDDIIERGAFAGFERNSMFAGYEGLNVSKLINPGLGLGAPSNTMGLKEMVDFYSNMHFLTWTGGWTGTVVEFFTRSLMDGYEVFQKGGGMLAKGFYIYPEDYFCPKDYYSGELLITANTRSIHHYAASWVPKPSFIAKLRDRIIKFYVRHF